MPFDPLPSAVLTPVFTYWNQNHISHNLAARNEVSDLLFAWKYKEFVMSR